MGTTQRRKPSPRLAAAAVLGLSLGCRDALFGDEAKRVERLVELSLDGVKLSHDQAGRTVTFDRATRTLSIWSEVGKRDRSCSVSEDQVLDGILGLNGTLVLFASNAGDHTLLTILDGSSCRLRVQRELKGIAVINVHPAKDGWLLQGFDSANMSAKGVSHRVLAITSDAKVWGTYELPDDVLEGPEPQQPFGKWSSAVDVSGEVWLVPQARYMFVRPRQKGLPDHAFVPTGCLKAEGRALTDAETRARARDMARDAGRSPLGAALQERADGSRKGESSLGAISAVASYRNLVAAVVRPSGGSSCRLDVWDLVTEKALLVKTLRSDCPVSFWFTDERLFYLADSRVIEWAFDRPLFDPLADPCLSAPAQATPSRGALPATPVDPEAATDPVATATPVPSPAPKAEAPRPSPQPPSPSR